MDKNPLFTKKPRFKKIAYYTILCITLHWSIIAPAQPMVSDYLTMNNMGMDDITSLFFEEETVIIDHYEFPIDDTLKTEKNVKNNLRAVKEEASRKSLKGIEETIFKADINEGIIGISREIPMDNPSDNLFKIQIDKLPLINPEDRLQLIYELHGVQSHNAVSRSINGELALGGYLVKRTANWSTQVEEINPKSLKIGENTILFTTPKNADHQYKIKNLRFEIKKGSQNGLTSLLVVQNKHIQFKKNNKIYIKGFVKGIIEGSLKVMVGSTQITSRHGVFEGLVDLDDTTRKYKLITISASDDTGLLGQEVIILNDHLIEADIVHAIEENKETTTLLGASIHLAKKDLSQKTKLSLRKMRHVDLAPLTSGIRNVTAHANGYRIHAVNADLKEPLKIAIAYDSLSIPNGYTYHDIKTFYFNTQKKSWVALKKDSLDIQNHQIITSVDLSNTGESSDYINGIIQTPESPTSSAFTPTMMNDIQAVDPSAAITLIAPPTASQRGDANISYPIRIPTGRNGMQPQVGLQYSNEGGNGWLGMGWNINTPRITIDTRWGTPTFTAGKESEIYSIDGEMLMYPDNFLPHRHQGDDPSTFTTNGQPRNSTGIKIFTPRKQGSFAKIERLGNNPTEYYWKVTDAYGSVHWYGGDSNGIIENAIVRDDNGNVSCWALRITEDVFRNNIKYNYTNATYTQNDNLNGGTYFYLNNIKYTGYEGNDGNYDVNFNSSNTVKLDASIDGRLGLKWVDPYLLENITVEYQNNLIRSYDLNYTLGRFTKNLLTSVTENDKEGNEFYTHEFDYYDDITLNNNALFKAPINIEIPSLGTSFANNFGQQVFGKSIINSSENIETGFNARLAAGLEIRPFIHSQDKTKLFTAGTPFGENSFRNKGKISLTDINGDGLDDIIYRTSNGLKYIPNSLTASTMDGIDFENSFEGSTELDINNAFDFQRSKGFSKTIFGESYDFFALGFYAGTSRIRTNTENSIYLTDGNGDGLIDIVRDDEVYFNTIDAETGEPSFEASSLNTENMLVTAGSGIANWVDPDEEIESPEEQSTPSILDFDAVKVWIAPRDGSIRITDRVRTQSGTAKYTIETKTNTIGFDAPFRIYDGEISSSITSISLTNYENDAFLGLTAQGFSYNGPITVNKGQKIYFRVHQEGSNPVVLSTLGIHYLDATTQQDEVFRSINQYFYRRPFFVGGTGNVTIPSTGDININWPSFTVKPQDEMFYRVYRTSYNPDSEEGSNKELIFQKTCPPGVNTTVSPNGNELAFNIQSFSHDDANVFVDFQFEVDSDSNQKWITNTGGLGNFNPTFTFTPNGDGEAFSSYPVPKFAVYRAHDFTPDYFHRLDSALFGTPPTSNNVIEAKPSTTITDNTIFEDTDNGSFLFIVKESTENLNGYVLGKIRVDIVDGSILIEDLPENDPIPLFTGNPGANDEASFAIGFYARGIPNSKLLEKYIAAVGKEESVIISHDFNNPNKTYNTAGIEFYEGDKPQLGTINQGWGQFFYNENYDDSNLPSDPIGKLINEDIVENPTINLEFANIPGCDPTSPDYATCVMESLGLPAEGTEYSNPAELEALFENLDAWIANNNFQFPEIAFVPPTATKSNASGSSVRWIGLTEDQFFTGSGIKTVNLGNSGSSDNPGGDGPLANTVTDDDQEGVWGDFDANTGMHAITKESKSSSRNFGAGYGFVFSASDTGFGRNVTDFMDVNGDSYPDILYSNNHARTNMTGGHDIIGNHDFGPPGVYDASNVGLSNPGALLNAGRMGIASLKNGGSTSSTTPSAQSDLGAAINRVNIASVNLAGDTEQEAFFADINGDGLVDRVVKQTNGFNYLLNKGEFLNDETGYEDFSLLEGGVSSPATLGLNFGLGGGTIAAINIFGSGAFSGAVSVNAGASASQSNSDVSFQDINGDGLSDLVLSSNGVGNVRFNNGNHFSNDTFSLNASGAALENPNLTGDSRSRAIAASIDGSGFFGTPICCPIVIPPGLPFFFPLIHIKYGVTIGGNVNLAISDVRKAFKDFNGDGFVDFMQQNGDNLQVYYSAVGRTNKLKTVSNPLGGSFTVDYNASPKSYDNPNAKWVMKSVLVDDGYDLVNDGEERYLTEFNYDNAKYDRRERMFYGFEKVSIFDYQEDLETVYRTTVSIYHNENYFLNGLMKASFVLKGEATTVDSFPPNSLFSSTENFYTIYGLEDDNQHADLNNELPQDFDQGGREGRGTAIVLMTKTENSIYELTTDPIISRMEMEYDDLGRVSSYTDFGDITDPTHNYTSSITYHDNNLLIDKNLIHIPENIQVRIGSVLKRERTTSSVNFNTGTIGRISAKISGNTNAVTDMEYDNFGNLIKVTYPENLHGDRMFYAYTYDVVENKYLVETTDAYGYVSQATYDYEFDTPMETVDIAGNSMNYEYDLFARTTRIIGPKEQGNANAFTIKYAYYVDHDDLNGVAQVNENNFMPVSVTSHYDVQNPENPIETYNFVDGLARTIQVKKDIRFISGFVDGTGNVTDERMSISGKTTYDHLGRGIKTYHPWHEKKDSDLNFTVNNFEGIVYFSQILYDELDRSIQTIDAEGNDAYMEFTLDGNLHKTTSTVDQSDAAQIININFEDARGRNVKSTQVGPQGDLVTKFSFNAINEMQSYTDAEGITTTCGYDLLGRKVQQNHPDSGTTLYHFDQANNLIRMQNQRLLDANSFISYDYEFTRPIATTYPGQSNISNTTYAYGGPNEGNNTGRIISQRDATGTQEFSYGNMGEMEFNSRTVVGPNIPTRTYETRFSYDSWNRLLQLAYPDGEVVAYTYDHGGKLKTMEGTVGGQAYAYLKDVQYDHFEQTIRSESGNGAKTAYTYTPELRRLHTMRLIDGQNNVLLNNKYSYDKVRNVTNIQNTANASNEYEMGGAYKHSYAYDVLNRLTAAQGRFTGNALAHGTNGNEFKSGYNLGMAYNDTHGIREKKQSHTQNNAINPDNSFVNRYRYEEGSHKVNKIENTQNGYTQNMTYDANGNTTDIDDTNGNALDYYWDEINRLRVVDDQTMMQHYIYDAGNQRILKSSSDPTQVSENGSPIGGSLIVFDNYTTYPSNLIVMKGSGEYTKHYFNGGQRMVSRIGEEAPDFFDTTTFSGTFQEIQQLQIQDLQKAVADADRGSVSFKKYQVPKEDTATKKEISKGIVASAPGNMYFYHSDHLGTATYLTDASGNPYQFFLNLPFGETMAEQSSFTEDFNNRWKFNGKELDSETGLYYYGARYYNPSNSLWLSVDPLAGTMPSWSPYNYAFNNPLRFIDPDGMAPYDVIITGKDADRATKALNKSSSLKIKRNSKTGKLSAKGKAKTDYDKALLAAITDNKINVKLRANSVKEIAVDGIKSDITLGAYAGSQNINGKTEALQMVNMDQIDQVEKAGIMKGGHIVGHEVIESHIAAKENKGNNRANSVNGDIAYDKGHKEALRIADPKFIPLIQIQKIGKTQLLIFKNNKTVIID